MSEAASACLCARPGSVVEIPPPLAAPRARAVISSAADDEAQLVAAARVGEAAAFETLVHRYERRIFRLALNITQNHEDAEEVMQDAFLKAFAHLADFRGQSRFYTWLVRIAVNQALMKLRKRRPNHFSLDEPVEAEDGPLPREIEDWGPTPEEHFERAELNHILAESMNELALPCRAVFQLFEVEEFSLKEIAEMLNISLPAVKSRLSRARLRLRDSLDHHFRAATPARR